MIDRNMVMSKNPPTPLPFFALLFGFGDACGAGSEDVVSPGDGRILTMACRFVTKFPGVLSSTFFDAY